MIRVGGLQEEWVPRQAVCPCELPDRSGAGTDHKAPPAEGRQRDGGRSLALRPSASSRCVRQASAGLILDPANLGDVRLENGSSQAVRLPRQHACVIAGRGPRCCRVPRQPVTAQFPALTCRDAMWPGGAECHVVSRLEAGAIPSPTSLEGLLRCIGFDSRLGQRGRVCCVPALVPLWRPACHRGVELHPLPTA